MYGPELDAFCCIGVESAQKESTFSGKIETAIQDSCRYKRLNPYVFIIHQRTANDLGEHFVQKTAICNRIH